ALYYLAVVRDDLLVDFLVEEPIRSGDVAGQVEPRKRGHGRIRRAPHPGLDHASVPDGDTVRSGQIMDLLRFDETAHPSGLDVDHRGGSEHDRIGGRLRSEEHTSELQSRFDLVCRLLLEKK